LRMQNPSTELKELVIGVVNTSIKAQDTTVEKYYAQHAKLIHPLLEAQGKNEIADVFNSWALINWILTPTINKIVYDNANEAVIDVTQTFRLWMFPFIEMSVRVVVMLSLIDDPKGSGKLVERQEDVIVWQSILSWLPFIGCWYSNTGRRLCGIAVVYATRIARLSIGLAANAFDWATGWLSDKKKKIKQSM